MSEENDKLEQLQCEFQEFTHRVSHDLKAPIRNIKSYSEFLIEDYSDVLDAQGVESLNTIKKLSIRTDSMLNAILWISRLQRKQIVVVDIDLEMLKVLVLKKVSQDFPYAKDCVEWSGLNMSLLGDFDLVADAFYHLIDNGLRYNKSDEPKMKVELLENNRVSFSDNGIGIDKKHEEQVFSVFCRLNGNENFGDRIGSGLTFSRLICERHGGTLRLESKLGHGSTFFLNFGTHQI